MPYDNIGVVGAGAWGTALAQTLARRNLEAILWAHEVETANEINAFQTNSVFLPGVPLASNLKATADLNDLAGCDLLLLVPPAQHLARIGSELASIIAPHVPLVICSKGIEQSSGRLLSEALVDAIPRAKIAALSGPSFAAEVARGLPAALTVACPDASVGEHIATSLGSKQLRLYWTEDLIGVQLGGAIKNVLAIAAGIVAGRALGANAHAALVTRGFAEMQRFASAHGAMAETMTGLAGLGDLLLTCGSTQSRNMSLGRALGEGSTLSDILGNRRAVTEGVYTAAAMVRMADKENVEVPIARAVHDIVEGRIDVNIAIEDLMTRPPRAETSGL